MLFRISIFSFLFFGYTYISFSQNIKISAFTIQEGDTILTSNIPSIQILEFKDYNEKIKYNILKRKVKKVYPYAIIAKTKMLEIQKTLDTIPKRRKKKKYARLFARWLKEEYSKKLKNLTMSEGRILVKLIYRETNMRTYDLVKIYRGRFNAFFWQTVAKIYDNNLKTGYDPENIYEDKLIEYIIQEERLENKKYYLLN